jgi:hypothetical protein
VRSYRKRVLADLLQSRATTDFDAEKFPRT